MFEQVNEQQSEQLSIEQVAQSILQHTNQMIFPELVKHLRLNETTPLDAHYMNHLLKSIEKRVSAGVGFELDIATLSVALLNGAIFMNRQCQPNVMESFIERLTNDNGWEPVEVRDVIRGDRIRMCKGDESKEVLCINGNLERTALDDAKLEQGIWRIQLDEDIFIEAPEKN